jgi:dienelactone hydrolase
MRYAAVACALLAAPAVAPADPPAEQPPITTVPGLWAGFDPRAVPLDVEVVRAWDEGEVHLETVYFTGELFEGEKTRVFGHLGRPKVSGGKVPGVLHVHGGGQTAGLDWPRFWAKRGYACLSFDFCGNTNLPGLGPEYRRERYTLWGRVPADMMKVGGGLSMKPSPRYNPWYHWALAARRGLTFLETRPEVDGDRLGVFGVSVGGTLTWGIAALDERVKAAAPVYGCGWEFYQYPPDLKAPVSDDLKLWRSLIAPEAHAANVKCPIFLLSATNDGHGRMDLAFRTLDLVPAAVKGQVFTANYDHHVEPAEAGSLPLFMDAHLKGAGVPWPATPRVEIGAGDGVPVVRVKPAVPDRVGRVDVYYCLNNDWPTARFWRTVPDVRRGPGGFVGPAPFLAPTDVLYAFANVTYESGVRVSSRLVTMPAAEVAGVKPTLVRQTLIDTMDTARDWSWGPAYTDPNRDDRFFADWAGPDGERGFTLDPKTFNRSGAMTFHFGTRKVGDPQFRGAGRTALLLDYFAANAPDKLTVRITHRLPGQNPTAFTAVPPEATGQGAWRTWKLEPGQFRDATGTVLPSWDHFEQLVLIGTSPANRPPVFKRLRWAE